MDFNFPAPLDMTNISLNYDDAWLDGKSPETNDTFLANVHQAMRTGEPGFSFNFGHRRNETLRNACTEVTSADDSDVCNLGSVNMSRIDTLTEFEDVCALGTMFLMCGTMVSEMPYEKAAQVRDRNRRIGLGLMGVHEWLIRRGHKYIVTPELHLWLMAYRSVSNAVCWYDAKDLGITTPIGMRAIAPTGSIGILAGTTTGIEPLYAVAYKRRYLKGKDQWVHQYVVDGAAQAIIDETGVDPDSIESSIDLANDVERRIQFQADVQDYVDMGISSTVNLPAWGTEHNNASLVLDTARTIKQYAHRLRGLTFYPDGSRGGQPLTAVSYSEAINRGPGEYVEETHDVCSISGKGGVCGA
jgi:ribonucleoside-diphosphate reductase alpha chain